MFSNEEQCEQIDDDFEEQPTENEESPNLNSKKRKTRVDAVIKGITLATNILGEKLEKAANSMNQAIIGEMEVQKKASMVIPEISNWCVVNFFNFRLRIINDICCFLFLYKINIFLFK